MEATWDYQMLWSCAEDVDELVIPSWVKPLIMMLMMMFNYFSNVMVLEPKPQSDEDVVVQPGDDLVVQDVSPPKKVKFHPDPDDALLQQLLATLKFNGPSVIMMMPFSNNYLATLKLNVPSIISTLSVLWILLPRKLSLNKRALGVLMARLG
ncbi:hypothetical protein RND81_13G072900 [Saponaria officinalis]|uniref:Uncharacterized protein n=1 Tax=Saponaria officinalis TaxID=3572 RepID=A0AAW1GV37_SAPOF